MSPADTSTAAGPPRGYREGAVGGTLVVARLDCYDAVCAALRAGSLHAWASAQPGARAMAGRGVAWATRLPDGPDVVVRHSRHGGMLASLTGDLFIAPTRAPRELDTSLRLRASGVRTPELLAYVVYTAAGPLCRADVVTELVNGLDLPGALQAHHAHQERHEIRVAVSRLMEALWIAGAHHPDLNARNVLVATPLEARKAYVLDVDRVVFGKPRDERPREMLRNSVRLQRSLRKVRDGMGIDLTLNEILALANFRQHGNVAVIEPPTE